MSIQKQKQNHKRNSLCFQTSVTKAEGDDQEKVAEDKTTSKRKHSEDTGLLFIFFRLYPEMCSCTGSYARNCGLVCTTFHPETQVFPCVVVFTQVKKSQSIHDCHRHILGRWGNWYMKLISGRSSHRNPFCWFWTLSILPLVVWWWPVEMKRITNAAGGAWRWQSQEENWWPI